MAGDDLKIVTKTVEVPLALEDGEWKLVSDEDVVDAIFGGLFSYDPDHGEE